MALRKTRTMLAGSKELSISIVSQQIRIGTSYDEANDDVQVIDDHDTLIHVKDLESTDPTSYYAVVGKTFDDTLPGNAEYIPEELAVYVHGGWAFASGHRPKLRTKRAKLIPQGTDVAMEVIPPGGSTPPEDGEHRGYFLNTVKGQIVEVQLLDGTDAVISTIYLECTDNSPGDDATHAYVTPGQECYVSFKANATSLDATTDVTKQPGTGWAGRDDDFLTDIKDRVDAMIV